jgi:hypothetical protein
LDVAGDMSAIRLGAAIACLTSDRADATGRIAATWFDV